MSKDKGNAFSGKIDIYTLDEASAKKRSIPLILEMAADGHISLCTTIPIGWEIYNIENAALPACKYKKTSLTVSTRPGENYIGAIEKADPAIELLTLSAEDCKNINKHGHTKQGAFSEGLKTAYNHPPLRTTPIRKSIYTRRYDIAECLLIFSRCFAICKKPTPKEETIKWDVSRFPYQEITITKDMIRITQDELEKISESTDDHQPANKAEPNSLNNNTSLSTTKNQYLKNISQRLYTPGKARTKLLQTLYQASKISWETFRATGTYPCSEDIENCIKKICPEFSNNLAKKSAAMITPFADDIKKAGNPFLTNYFWALIDTYEKYYRSPLESKIDQDEILAWLEDDLKMNSLAIDGRRIIDPNFKANKDAVK